jgi:hypothetical protein
LRGRNPQLIESQCFKYKNRPENRNTLKHPLFNYELGVMSYESGRGFAVLAITDQLF